MNVVSIGLVYCENQIKSQYPSFKKLLKKTTTTTTVTATLWQMKKRAN